jgi:hypothetical protein
VRLVGIVEALDSLSERGQPATEVF